MIWEKLDMVDKDYFGIIYRVTNIINGKIYVGQTVQTLEYRKNSHFNESKRSRFYFHQAIIRYGQKNFIWTILEHCDSKEELDEMEFHYIKQYNSFRPGGYNLTYGGDGTLGLIPNEETRNKMSKASKGHKMTETARQKLILNHADFSGKNNPMYGVVSPMKGKHHSNETIRKISMKLKGRRLSEEHKTKLSESHKKYGD